MPTPKTIDELLNDLGTDDQLENAAGAEPDETTSEGEVTSESNEPAPEKEPEPAPEKEPEPAPEKEPEPKKEAAAPRSTRRTAAPKPKEPAAETAGDTLAAAPDDFSETKQDPAEEEFISDQTRAEMALGAAHINRNRR